ncbi:predicted protein [Botrytis cinerea T4]|uniref:Uncharacterized protein n=1 Tax=Botryotinia fuckeliana (strain T4) TaxID=999810 RepID=G2XP15_BOTF4|nr:predicted protein [Botrytis cinerea T4]
MSASVTKPSHMEKVELRGPKVHTILSQLGEWLPNAKFERDGKVEKCADADLDHYCRPLFDELDILSKENRSSPMQQSILSKILASA